MSIWKAPITIEAINQRNANTFSSHLKIEFVELGDDYLKARMPVIVHHLQPFGTMHGGASCALAETVASAAANYCIDSRSYYCIGIEINTNHIRTIRSGYIYATAKPFHLGKTTQVWSIEIRDAKEQLISINRLTLAVLKKKYAKKLKLMLKKNFNHA